MTWIYIFLPLTVPSSLLLEIPELTGGDVFVRISKREGSFPQVGSNE